MTDRMVRWAGIAGIIFVVLIVITIFAGGSPPMADDPVDKIRDYYLDHRGGLLFSNLLGLFAVPFALWFGAVLRDMFRGDRFSNTLGTASLLGLVATAALAMAGGAVSVAPVYMKGAADTFGDDTLRIIYETQMLLFAATGAGIALFAGAAAVAIRRTRALPPHTMWLAALATVGAIVSLFATVGAGASALGFVGISTFALFILVTGITMVVGKATASAPVAATAS